MMEIESSSWKTINQSSLEFILKEAQTRVSFINEQSNRISNRAYSILTILITILSVLIGLISSQFQRMNSFMFLLLLLLVIAFMISMSILVSIISPRQFSPSGRLPSELNKEKYYHGDDALRLLFLNELTNCDSIIRSNYEINGIRMAKLKLVIRIVTCTTTLTAFCMIATWAFFLFNH
jgi:hypothetical protein